MTEREREKTRLAIRAGADRPTHGRYNSVTDGTGFPSLEPVKTLDKPASEWPKTILHYIIFFDSSLQHRT